MYKEVYIDDPSNREWFEKYKYDIPVIHIDGDYLMKHRVNEHLLRRALNHFPADKELVLDSQASKNGT